MKFKTLITAPAYFDCDAIKEFKKFSIVTLKQYSPEELLKYIPDYHILAIRVDTIVNKQLLDAATNLKVIATATTGINHIDVEYAKNKGIEVISLQGANTIATAEHTLALLLTLIRKIPAAHASLLRGEWNRAAYIGTELSGKKLGIVGFGRIGRDLAVRARAFGMEILAYDPYLKPEDFVQHHAAQKDLNALLTEADIITLHLLLTPETKGMINKERLSLLRPNAILLNCSRGEVVVDQDLVEALGQKRIACAALDVFPEEPLRQTSPLIAYAKTHDNLILTPHLAGSTHEAIHQAGLYAATKTKEFLKV